MDYFLVRPDSSCGETVNLGLEEPLRSDTVLVQPFQAEVRYLDFYANPCFLFSERLKKLLALYRTESSWLLLALVDPGRGAQTNYFSTDPPIVDCLSQKSIFTLDKRIKRLVLRRSAIGDQAFFTPKGLTESLLIVSLPLAESILRRGLYGLIVERIANYEEA